MMIKEIKNRQEYNKYISAQKHSQFTQSWEWGEFQEFLGFSILRLGLFVEGELKFATTLIKKKILAGKSYYYCPRVRIKHLSFENLELFLDYVDKISGEEKVIFLRFEPRSDSRFTTHDSRFKLKKTLDVQPCQTMILDLSKTEDELLRAMHAKTRYNIRLAKRKGVEILEAPIERFDEFWNLMKDTGGRDGFRLHDKNHYKKMLEINSIDFKVKLFFAEYKGEVITANIVSYFGNMVTYVHGASSSKNRNIMAPYLLQWHVIVGAKNKGYLAYDFHGIGKGSLSGVTRFKKGFAGKEINYPGVYDIIFDKYFYSVYEILRKIRRIVKL